MKTVTIDLSEINGAVRRFRKASKNLIKALDKFKESGITINQSNEQIKKHNNTSETGVPDKDD